MTYWVVPEKIHTPPTEEISAVRRGRGEKIVSDNSKCIRTSERGRGVNFLFPPGGGMDVFWNDPLCKKMSLEVFNICFLHSWQTAIFLRSVR
jgi:hypothetical protein